MRYPHHLMSLALVLALAGCQAQGLVGVGAGGATPGGGQQGVQPGAGAAVTTKLGAYEFKPLSAEAAASLATRASAAPRAEAAGDAAAPMAPTAGVGKMASSAMTVMPGSPYSHGTFFSGPYGPMKLESATEAQGPGSTAGWAEIKAQVVAPVLADWGADGRLIASRGVLDGDGNTATGEERWPGELGWHATYAAASRNEVLEFHVTAKGTTITRLKWAPVDLNLDAAAVDARTALAAIGAAIKDADARSEEDKLGYDYFFGKDGGPVHIMNRAVPAIAVTEPMPVDLPPDAKPGVAPKPYPSPEALFTLTPGGRWNASLNAINDKVVWELYYDPGEKAWQPPTGNWSTDPSAYGMIDAATGALIRLRRPTKYYLETPIASDGGAAAGMTRPAGEPQVGSDADQAAL